MRAVFLALLSALLASGGDAGEPRIAALEVIPAAGRIDISFVLEDVFDDQLVERIQTGLPTGFDFKIKLVRSQRWWWFDPDIREADFSVVAMYNAVTGEYLVNYKKDGKLIESRVVREIRDLRDAMTRFEDLHAIDTTGLEEDRSLWVRVRGILGSRHRLFIIPTTIETDWADSRRFRLPELPR
jgi:hypothetical protein